MASLCLWLKLRVDIRTEQLPRTSLELLDLLDPRNFFEVDYGTESEAALLITLLGVYAASLIAIEVARFTTLTWLMESLGSGVMRRNEGAKTFNSSQISMFSNTGSFLSNLGYYEDKGFALFYLDLVKNSSMIASGAVVGSFSLIYQPIDGVTPLLALLFLIFSILLIDWISVPATLRFYHEIEVALKKEHQYARNLGKEQKDDLNLLTIKSFMVAYHRKRLQEMQEWRTYKEHYERELVDFDPKAKPPSSAGFFNNLMSRYLWLERKLRSNVGKFFYRFSLGVISLIIFYLALNGGKTVIEFVYLIFCFLFVLVVFNYYHAVDLYDYLKYRKAVEFYQTSMKEFKSKYKKKDEPSSKWLERRYLNPFKYSEFSIESKPVLLFAFQVIFCHFVTIYFFWEIKNFTRDLDFLSHFNAPFFWVLFTVFCAIFYLFLLVFSVRRCDLKRKYYSRDLVGYIKIWSKDRVIKSLADEY